MTSTNAFSGGAAKGQLRAIQGLSEMVFNMQIADNTNIARFERDYTVNPYSNRILDALARMFYAIDESDSKKPEDDKLKTICAAVAVKGTECLVSFNCNASAPLKAKVQNIWKIISSAQGKSESEKASIITKLKKHLGKVDSEKIAESHPYYTKSVKGEKADLLGDIDKLPDSKNPLKDACRKWLNFKYCSLASIDDLEAKAMPRHAHDPLLKAVFNFVRRDLSSRDDVQHAFESLEQDCKKVIKFFDQSALSYVTKIVFLPNLEIIHCELNVKKHLGTLPAYIGISKLSCLTCHVVLSPEEEETGLINHSGTHGIVYPIEGLPTSVISDQDMALFEYLRGKLASCAKVPIDKKLNPYLQCRSISPPPEEEVFLMGHSGAASFGMALLWMAPAILKDLEDFL